MSEVKLDKDVQLQLMQHLEELESSTDLEGTALVTKSGIRIASSTHMGVDEDAHSATPATLINLGQMVADKAGYGNLQEIVLTGEDGYTIVTTKQDSDFMLLSHCKLAAKLGYYFHRLRKSFDALTTLLQGIEIGAGSF